MQATDCDVVSNVVINYYGSEERVYRQELESSLEGHTAASRLRIGIFPTQYGLGHRFHVFEEHGYAIAQSPLVLILDDDVTTTCDGVRHLLTALRKKTDNRTDKLKERLPFSSLVAMSIQRGAAYKTNGDIQYVYKKGKGIALTTSLLLPLELIRFFVHSIPEEVLKPIDDNKNCEDILMNFVSAFLNNNHAMDNRLKYSKFIPDLVKPGTGLSLTKNTMFHRSSCIYWIDKLFQSFDIKLLPTID
jgi:hypothetical protein